MALTHVLRPITINGLEIRNRIIRTAHGTYYGKGFINDDLIAYHAARAKAGVGLSTLEVTCVHKSSVNYTLFGWDDSVIPGFKRIADAVHVHGMKLFSQLWHGGQHWPPIYGGPAWSASAIPSPWGGIPLEMTQDQIDEIVESFAAAAVRAREGGLDGVELHFGHGYLVHQFLSPMTNHRSDGYGGDLAGRTRFGIEILKAVRKAAGNDFPVGIRISDQHVPGGLTVEDCAETVRRLCAAKLIDFVNASMGSYHDPSSMLPTLETPPGAMLPSSGPIAAAADVPRMIAGRYRTLEEADQAIREGSTDMVGIVRAMIADSELIPKTLAGRATEVRPCIGCNQGCVGGILTAANRILCTVNPAVGQEATLGEDLIVPTTTPKKVVVVGGGPAGLEAARLAALSGHRVVLFEAQRRLGGVINIARRGPGQQGFADFTDWIEPEVYRLGVDVRLSTYAEAEDVLAEAPDVVIVATGSLPRMDGVQAHTPQFPASGMDQGHVHSAHDLFDVPRERLGRTAVVYDDTGQYEGISAAEHLIDAGLAVTVVTRLPAFAHSMDVPMRLEPALRRMRAKGDLTVLTRSRLVAIGEAECTVVSLEGGKPWMVPADTVVFIGFNQPQNGLWYALGGGTRAETPYKLIAVGDAWAPRDLVAAIREGHMAGRFLGAEGAPQ